MKALAHLPPKQRVNQTPYIGHHQNGKRLRYHGERHLLSFGGTGAGKSTSLVIPNLASLYRSMVVIDPKGELAAITARRRAQMGKVIVINPFGVWSKKLPRLESAGWNPLLQLQPDSADFPSDARKIAQAMGTGGKSDHKGEFFESSQENLLTAFIMWERLISPRPSLRNVRKMLASPMEQLLMDFDLMAKSPISGLSIIGSRLKTRLSDKNSQSTSIQDVIETALKNMSFLDDDRIDDDMTRGGAIDFATFHQEITTVFLVLPVDQIQEQAKWLRMFVKIAMSQLVRSPPDVAELPPVLFMLDEFGNLGRLPDVLNMLNIGRAQRLQLWMFLQNIDQIKKTNYPDEWTYFFSAAGAKTTFAATDTETGGEWCRMIGKTEKEVTSYTKSGGHLLTGYFDPRRVAFSETRAPHVTDLVALDELARIKRGGMLGFIEPCPYVLPLFTPGYWQSQYFGDMFNPADLDANPYYHG